LAAWQYRFSHGLPVLTHPSVTYRRSKTQTGLFFLRLLMRVLIGMQIWTQPSGVNLLCRNAQRRRA
jgi:hypothetical protein